MELWWIVLSLALTAFVAADDSCPDPDQISPCTCDGEGVNCMGARTLPEVRKTFKANYKYGAVRSVWIQGTPITDIPRDLFGSVKSHQFYIEMNNITSLDFGAFSASKTTVQVLSLFGNKLDSLKYSDLSQYENLGLINLGRNQITSIPANAFNSTSLGAIILAQNKISSIGMNAFSNLPNLARLELSQNNLATLGQFAFAIRAHSAGLQINLSSNKITSVEKNAFQGAELYGLMLSNNKLTSLKYEAFGDLMTSIGQRGGFIEVSANPLSCKGCDYSWIVLNKDILRSRLIGFTCTDGRSILDLTKSNIGC